MLFHYKGVLKTTHLLENAHLNIAHLTTVIIFHQFFQAGEMLLLILGYIYCWNGITQNTIIQLSSLLLF